MRFPKNPLDVGVAAVETPIESAVVRAVLVNPGSAFGQRLVGLGDRAERLVVDRNRFDGIDRDVRVLGDHYSHRIPDVAHFVGGEREALLLIDVREVAAVAAR